MAGSNTYGKLVTVLKKNGSLGYAAAIKAAGGEKVNMLTFSQAQVEAGAVSKIKPTAAQVRKARDSDGNRWELISARTGESVARVKALYKEAGGDPTTAFRGGSPKTKEANAKKQAAKAKDEPKRGRGRPRGSGTTGGKNIVRRRTRASASNPS